MITAREVEIRLGARLLLAPCSFTVNPGDRIGLVGRNGAGKTTLTKILAGDGLPSSGEVTRSGHVGYLPQDPRTGDLHVLAKDRILSARGLDQIIADLRMAEERMASPDKEIAEKAGRRWTALDEAFHREGGYSAESEAGSIALSLGLAPKVLDQPLETLSGGQRRRVELARILFQGSSTCGLIVISHDAALLDRCANKIFYLDANRSTIDIYNLGWTAYLQQREIDERRRKREQANAEKQAGALKAQADRMRYKATKARAAQSMDKRAARILDSIVEGGGREKVARIRFPDPVPCGKTPLMAHGLSKSYGSSEIFTDVDLAIDRGSRVVILGLNGAGKTTLLRLLSGIEAGDTGRVELGHGARLGYYAQEHETLDVTRTVLENMQSASPDLAESQVRSLLGSFLFIGDDVFKPAGVLSGGEKTRLALACLVVSGANVLLLDEPTNNLDPASRAEILEALGRYEGAVVLVTHDDGAVEALNPERVLLLPDGVEDLWRPDYLDLIALA
ncbi:MAG: ABC transporter ATP-binding protein [Actinobacteria bacterium]|nr:ABC transporter ATP-binding protein [Actinomycetota bacterium]